VYSLAIHFQFYPVGVSGNFLVRQARGPAWDRARRRREQAGWEEHAEMMVGAERRGAGDGGPAAYGGRLALARAMLVLLCLYALVLGTLAAFAPHTFYDDFPFFSHWVELLPPYNEHLVTDVGGLYLALAVIFAWAAWSLQRTLVRAACTGFLVAAVLHLVFHAGHLEGFGTVDGVAEIAALASLLLPPAIAIWGTDDAT
jgi:hypothetical protein